MIRIDFVDGNRFPHAPFFDRSLKREIKPSLLSLTAMAASSLIFTSKRVREWILWNSNLLTLIFYVFMKAATDWFFLSFCETEKKLTFLVPPREDIDVNKCDSWT